MEMKQYTVKVFEDLTEWRNSVGELDRENGPAREYTDGTKIWYKNGKLHREGNSAQEFANGNKFWFKEGERHREDGPACEYVNGDKYWYLEGKGYTEAEFLALTSKTKTITCEGKVIEIDGKKYSLTLLDK